MNVLTENHFPTVSNVSTKPSLKEIFSELSGNTVFRMGTVVVPPGTRIPEEGVSNHTENEFSVIVSGEIVTEIKGETYTVKKGQATYIPAGEEHVAYNNSGEACEIVWVMLRD